MENKWMLILILGIILILTFGIFLYTSRQAQLEYPQYPSEECHTLEYNGEDAINLVYFSNEENTKEYVDFLFESSPFDQRRKDFNIYYIDADVDCELYKGIAVLCYSKDNIKKAASCPNDYILAVKDINEQLRSSSYTNFVSLNINQPLPVQTHELGHAIANLAEEYINNQRPKGPNCVIDCSDFNGLNEGCFTGCSLNTMTRSIDSGVMRTLNTNEYGEFNKAVMIEEIDSTIAKKSSITGFTSHEEQDCSGKYFLFTIDANTLQFTKKEEFVGCASFETGAGDFTYNIISNEGEPIGGGGINLFELFTDVPDENNDLTGEVYTTDFPIYITTPSVGESIEIRDEKGNLIAQTSLRDAGARPCLI